MLRWLLRCLTTSTCRSKYILGRITTSRVHYVGSMRTVEYSKLKNMNSGVRDDGSIAFSVEPVDVTEHPAKHRMVTPCCIHHDELARKGGQVGTQPERRPAGR